jgi:hypothetical protein
LGVAFGMRSTRSLRLGSGAALGAVRNLVRIQSSGLRLRVVHVVSRFGPNLLSAYSREKVKIG